MVINGHTQSSVRQRMTLEVQFRDNSSPSCRRCLFIHPSIHVVETCDVSRSRDVPTAVEHVSLLSTSRKKRVDCRWIRSIRTNSSSKSRPVADDAARPVPIVWMDLNVDGPLVWMHERTSSAWSITITWSARALLLNNSTFCSVINWTSMWLWLLTLRLLYTSSHVSVQQEWSLSIYIHQTCVTNLSHTAKFQTKRA